MGRGRPKGATRAPVGLSQVPAAYDLGRRDTADSGRLDRWLCSLPTQPLWISKMSIRGSVTESDDYGLFCGM
jgi:hypothetical protein